MLSNNIWKKGIKKLEKIQHPALLSREFNRIWHRNLYYRDYYSEGVDIFNEDWDNLIILDACRYDIFKEVNYITGTLKSKMSRGSHTSEFLKGNFDGQNQNDIVYVTASPMLDRLRPESISVQLHDIINVWADGGWDEEYGTVPPDTTTHHAIEAAKTYPEKRLVVHYLQPHYPFLTDTHFDKGQIENSGQNRNFWEEKMLGRLDINREQIWSLYRFNLEQVLNSLELFLYEISGKTIVTSDHGNMIGDRSFPIPIKEWGHPYGMHVEKLLKVPWLVVQGSERKTIQDGETQDNGDVNSSQVTERLNELGYLDI